MEKYKNKYRIPSARLPYWDYGQNAAYFITICTKNREHYFGEIITNRDAMHCVSTIMQLSEIGKIVKNEWIKTPELRPDMNLKLGEFVVMPNHFHGIIIISENPYNVQQCRDAMHCVSTAAHCVSATNTQSQNQFGPQSKNLASIIRGFKIGVTKHARIINPHFTWQSRYYDHIIRDEKSYNQISAYIIDNPHKWQDDKYYA
jgi:REP element-mobilizing transposase RayT